MTIIMVIVIVVEWWWWKLECAGNYDSDKGNDGDVDYSGIVMVITMCFLKLKIKFIIFFLVLLMTIKLL